MSKKDDDTTTTETTTVLGTDTATNQGTENDDDNANSQTQNEPETDETQTANDDETDESTTTFSRTYVEKLRRESAGYRERANRADELATRLHTALVAATGRMADPTDLAFDESHLDDEDALITAIDELLARKPHLASRRVYGDVGQGNRGPATEPPVNLADLLRARA